MAKQSYYTKCGRKFEKNSTAVVTGYELGEDGRGKLIDRTCAKCPWPVEVKDGWPLVHKRWECRAGSQPPNHETTWRGSLDDKNTIQIDSLDHGLMEEIRQYCIDHPELGAGYNADCMADCRRTLSVSCSQNKKGIAAKKELIEKFFPENKEEISLTSDEGLYYCEKEDCPFNDRKDGCCFAQEDHDECFAKDLISAIKDYDCENENVQFAYKLIRPEAHIEEGEDPACETDESQTNSGNGSCASGTVEATVILNAVSETATTAEDLKEENPSCSNCYWNMFKSSPAKCFGGGSKIYGEKIFDANMNICEFYLDTKSSNSEIEAFKENWKKLHKTCGSCSYYIQKLEFKDGCNLVHYECNNQASESYGKRVTQYTIDCDVSGQVAGQMPGKDDDMAIDKEEICKELESIPSIDIEIKSFDYSTVDEETGAFLQEKANRITEIRIKSVIAMGKELKEAQDKLANNKTGTFQAWAESLGLSKSSTYNYINAYNYIVQNLDNIEDAEKIQPSLLFAASKPSAPKELADKVVSGDITTHKQYKELEQKLKDAEFHYDNVSKSYKRLEKVNTEHYEGKVRAENRAKQLEAEIAGLKNQLAVAPDASKIKELKATIVELEQQLHDKPIEIAATKVVEKEVIPDEVALAIHDKVIKLYEGIAKLTKKEIQIFAEQVEPNSYDDISANIDIAIRTLEKIQSAAYGATNMIEPEGHCGDCVNADMDAVTEEQLDEGKTLCTVAGQVVDIMDGCGKYKFFGAQS